MARILCALVTLLAVSTANAEVKFFFNTSPSDPPEAILHSAELVKFYDRYQSEYANYLDWLADKLVANETPEKTDTIVALRDLRERVFADEKAINAFANEQEASTAPQTGFALKVEAMRLQILLAYRKDLAYIVGAEALAVYDP